ncbi:MAG: hypothetical protein ACPL28_12245 [bacterium]
MSKRHPDIAAEVSDIKQFLIEISNKLDQLIYEKEISSIMKLSESTLSKLYASEPDIYNVSDIKVRYRSK